MGPARGKLLQKHLRPYGTLLAVTGQQDPVRAGLPQPLHDRIIRAARHAGTTAGHNNVQAQILGLRQIGNQRFSGLPLPSNHVEIINHQVGFRARPPGTVLKLLHGDIIGRQAAVQNPLNALNQRGHPSTHAGIATELGVVVGEESQQGAAQVDDAEDCEAGFFTTAHLGDDVFEE